jgi:Family of unknown function (DUF5565)
MRKTPTAFDRDWDGDRSRVVNAPHKDCGWVFAGEGIATRKLDGTCCMVRDSKLYKRRELRKGREGAPTIRGRRYGRRNRLSCDIGPENKWHMQAFEGRHLADGTYELVGPKTQGNPEEYAAQTLVSHNDPALIFDPQPPRDFDGLRAWMEGKDIEGIVWHHPDGRMAKLKLRDFGLKRKV